jgi:serine/threonine-protein kinase
VKDSDVKPQPSSPALRSAKKKCVVAGVVGTLVNGACVTSSASGPAAPVPHFTLPGPEACPPRALEQMAALGLEPGTEHMQMYSRGAWYFRLQYIGLQRVPNRLLVEVRHGQEVRARTEKRTTGLGVVELKGQAFIGQKRVFVRFTEARSVDGGGESFPVCLENADNVQRDYGHGVRYGRGTEFAWWAPEHGVATIAYTSDFRVVGSFRGGDWTGDTDEYP